MKTTESNKLIAGFMGWETKQNIVLIPYKFSNEQTRLLPKETDKYCADISDLGFHYDWNWLMPVVEKIETLNISGKNPEFFIMYDNRPEFHGWYWNIEVPKQFKKDCLGREATKIEAVYNAVHEFILWYNTKKTAN